MSKNLLDFAGSFVSSDRWTKGSYWSISSLPAKSYTLVEFEGLVIDKICDWKDYKPCPEFVLLNNYFKKGGKLSDASLLYNKLDILRSHSHFRGCDLVYSYAKNVLKGRLPSGAEEKFFRDLWNQHYGAKSAYKYAKYVVRGRLPVEYEKGCTDLDYLGFLESKGCNISDVLITSTDLSFYYYRKHYYLPEVVHNFMIAMQLSGDYYANIYFKQRNKDDKLIKGRLRMVDPNKTIGEVIKGL